MLDSTILATAAILLAGALISGYVKGREKDRSLNSFSGYHVTLEMLDGRLIWGEMTLHATGLELAYRSDVQDEHHIEASYILYKNEFPQIQAIYRYVDQMAGPQWARRQNELESSFHPNLWRRLQRRARTFLNLVSDSLGQAVEILVGQIQARSKVAAVGSQQYLGRVGQQIIGYVGTRYDPLLEHYVGTRVVVEVTEGGVVREHVGILKDYTADYLEILDVQYPAPAQVQIRAEQECREDHHLCVQRDGDTLRVTNIGERSLYLQHLRVGDEIKPLHAVLDREDELELHLPEGVKTEELELSAKIVRQLDWILPRAHALVRHKAERYDPDRVFDLGFVLKLDRHTDAEERYLEVLQQDPSAAPTAVELGQLLMQRGALREAERWFHQALDHRQNLADGGKLAERQLLSAERKRAVRRPEDD